MRSRHLLPTAMMLLLAACGSEKPAEEKKAAAPKAPEKPPEAYQVKLETTKGEVTIEVRREWAPRGADQFFELVKAGFYDGVRFHRVVRGFVCQFGINPDPKIQQLWTNMRIPDDAVKLKNRKGTITYAQLGKNSRTTQVFINLRDNLSLDADGFAPFGKVAGGMDVVEKLYYSYGEVAPRGSGPDPTQIELKGAAYLDSKFPRLDSIRHATVIK